MNKTFLLLFACSISNVQAQDFTIDPFKECEKTTTLAKPGEYILTPSYKWQKDASEKGPDTQTFVFYNAKMKTPGDKWSFVTFSSDGDKGIPNYMIIPISAGHKAKKGDVVLTWWQSGSGMNRAYVVNADKPDEPVVRYLDIDFDNPAKNKAGVQIGKMEEKLKPDTFIVIREKMSPGTAVAFQESVNRYVYARIVSVSEKKLLLLGFSGKMMLVDRNKCTALEIIPNVQPGDSVSFPWAGVFKTGIVKKVDTAIGRVFLDFSLTKNKVEEKVIAFGNIIKELPGK